VISAEARALLDRLECFTDHTYTRMSVGQRDQWTAYIRDSFQDEGVAISSPAEARAALIGIVYSIQVLFPDATLNADAVDTLVATMHTLAGKAGVPTVGETP